MEWFSKMIEVLKIPLKVLLPALWLFSGALTLLNEDVLINLNLLDWKKENGFILGLIFAITSCLMVVYIFFYLKNQISNLIFKLTLKRKTMKRIIKLNDAEFSVILRLYHSPGYSCTLDYNEPIIQGLLARDFIYSGSQQRVSMSIFDNAIPLRAIPLRLTLQPFVYQALDYYKPKIEKEIHRLESKANEEKDAKKKSNIIEKMENMKDYFNTTYYTGGNEQ